MSKTGICVSMWEGVIYRVKWQTKNILLSCYIKCWGKVVYFVLLWLSYINSVVIFFYNSHKFDQFVLFYMDFLSIKQFPSNFCFLKKFHHLVMQFAINIFVSKTNFLLRTSVDNVLYTHFPQWHYSCLIDHKCSE